MAIVSKESSFIPKEEKSYAGTSNARIRKIFGSRVGSYTDSQLNTLKANPVDFFNVVYGGRYGNASNEGYKYRGRGFNQITFKGSYEKRGNQVGIDLVNNPDKLNDPKVASKVAVAFLKDRVDSLKQKGKLKSYNADDINDFKNSKDAVLAMYHGNAGAGKSVSYIKGLVTNDPYGGMTRALSRAGSLVEAVKGFVKKKPLLTVTITAVMVLSVWALLKYSGIGKKNKVVKTIGN